MNALPKGYEAAARQQIVPGVPRAVRSVFNECQPVPEAGCWIAGGTIYPHGYAKFRPHKQRQMPAHRVAWMEVFGPIPDGLVVCHKCDTRPCINPGHLFLGTIGDNNTDRHAKGRDGRMPGEANGRAVVTAQQAAAIRNDTRFQRVIADEYGIAQTTVSAIKRRATWRTG